MRLLAPCVDTIKLSQKVVFINLKIKIVDRRFVCSLYAKPMALYLYLLPNSSHALGVLTGLVYGQVLQIYQLCSHSKGINTKPVAFYCHLLAREYHPCQILPLLKMAIDNACAHLSHTDDEQHFITQAKRQPQSNESSSTCPSIHSSRRLPRSNASGTSTSPHHQGSHNYTSSAMQKDFTSLCTS
jgi:hypothetical protein